MGLPVNDANILYQLQAANSVASVPATRLPQTVNGAVHTEDIAWVYFTLANTAAKSGLTRLAVVDGRLITLSEITYANVYGEIKFNASGAGYTPFVAGKSYLLSLYVWSPVDFWWHRRIIPSGGYGQGSVLCRAGELTRVHWVGTAYSTTSLDCGSVPTAQLGATSDGISLCAVNNNYGGAMATGSAPYIGGLQIESIPTGYVDGVALIGDSTMAGSSSWVTGGTTADLCKDFNTVANREVSTVLSSELRAPVFNRAIGGQRLDQMDARWATDISVIKHRCRDVIIQGGINDINQGRTLEQMQSSVQSMTSKAVADGFKGIKYLNVTPNAYCSANPTNESLRVQYNAWLVSMYGPAVCDISSVVLDTGTGNSLSSVAFGDGTHYTGPAKTAVAAKIVDTLDWGWRKTPGAYTRVQA